MDELRAKYCNRCNSQIVFIRTTSGKSMPCDVNPVMYRDDPAGTSYIFTHFGTVVRCSLECNETDYTGFGYIPHWGNCGAGQKRAEQISNAQPPAPQKKSSSKSENTNFEQLSLFGSDRRNRHPI